jgi:hypothetical protein
MDRLAHAAALLHQGAHAGAMQGRVQRQRGPATSAQLRPPTQHTHPALPPASPLMLGKYELIPLMANTHTDPSALTQQLLHLRGSLGAAAQHRCSRKLRLAKNGSSSPQQKDSDFQRAMHALCLAGRLVAWWSSAASGSHCTGIPPSPPPGVGPSFSARAAAQRSTHTREAAGRRCTPACQQRQWSTASISSGLTTNRGRWPACRWPAALAFS